MLECVSSVIDMADKALNGGHADGVFGRARENPFKPYSHTWHSYNIGWLNGRMDRLEKRIDTHNLEYLE